MRLRGAHQPVHGQPDLPAPTQLENDPASVSDCTAGQRRRRRAATRTSAPPSCRSFSRRGRGRDRRERPRPVDPGPGSGPGTGARRRLRRPLRRRRPRRPRCASTAGFRSVSARPRGRGLRDRASPAGSPPRSTVDVFQQSRGRRVIDNLLVARFTRQDPRRSPGTAGRATRQAADERRLLRALPDAAGRRAPRRPPRHAVRVAAGASAPGRRSTGAARAGSRPPTSCRAPVFGGPPGPPRWGSRSGSPGARRCGSWSPAAARARSGRSEPARTLPAARTGCRCSRPGCGPRTIA